MSTSARQRGLSLIELIIFMVVMGIAATAVLQMINYANRNSADPLRRKQALLLAESYLEEIELARFTYCDPVDPAAASATSVAGCATPEALGQEAASSVGRPYDNVSDYVTVAGAFQSVFTTGGVLSDVNGTALAVSGFTVTAALNAVPAVQPLGPAGNSISSSMAPANMNALRITIKVSYGSGSTDFVTLDGYRTRYAPNYVP